MRVGLVSSAAASPARLRALDRPGSRLERILVLAPVFVCVALLELALSDGGQHLETLAWVQTASMLTFAVIVWVGAVPRIAVSWSIVGMVAAIAVSSSISVRPESTVRELLLWLMYLSLFAVTASALSGPAATRRFMDAVVAIGVWLCGIALFLFWGAENPAMRWYSTFYWPNPFAAFLLLLLPVALVRFLHARGVRESFVHGAAAFLLSVSLIFTYSRGAWVSLVLTIPLALLVLRPPSWGGAALRIVLLTTVVAVVVVALTKGTVLRGAARGLGGGGPISVFEDLSFQGRLRFWQSGIRIFRDYPLLGTGAGTFGDVHSLYQRDVRFYAKDAHNRYLQTAAELGLVGVVTLAAIVVSAAILWWRTLQAARETDVYPLVAGIGLGLAAFALHSAVDMDWLFPANPALAFALIGALAAHAKVGHAPRRTWVPAQGAGWRGVAVAALLLAVAVVQVFQLAQRQFAAGQQLAQNGQWAHAADRYTEAVRWNPISARYWGALAVASIQLVPPRVEVATASIRRAMAVDRMDAAHPLQLARLVMSQGADPSRNAEEEALLLQALRLDPLNRPAAYRTLAALYFRQGRPDDARRVYDDAMERYRGRGLGRGSILYAQLWPEVTSVFMDAAESSVNQGDFPQAVKILRELLLEDPASVPAAVRLAALYVQVGRSGDAREVLEATAARVSDNGELRAALQKLR